MTPYAFVNESNLTKNDTTYLTYCGGTHGVADRVQAVVPFDCSIVGWSACLNTALPTDSSTLRVVVRANGASMTPTGALGGFDMSTDLSGNSRSTYANTTNLALQTVSAGQTLSAEVVASNHALAAANAIAVTIFTV
jgi:hypothetical protein